MFRRETALADALRTFRDRAELRVAILTGAGDRFFCIGGEHEPMKRHDYSETMPIVDVYELIDSVPKPVIAAVNGFADEAATNIADVTYDSPSAAAGVVHQATGMMAAQLDCGVTDALLRLRAYAYATAESVEDVAGRVVGRRLRFVP
jgi:naphthoate synthase